jgi:hypothetical protein
MGLGSAAQKLGQRGRPPGWLLRLPLRLPLPLSLGFMLLVIVVDHLLCSDSFRKVA